MSVINMECKLGMQLMIADNSIDAIVTDPPYGLSKQPKMEEVLKHWLVGDDYNATGSGFMGKTWDSFVPGPSIWKEAYRCLKPGAWAVVFAGSRTQDLMALSLRLAGFEIMDTGMWLYGSGFPKSLDISKAIDKSLGAEREVIGYKKSPDGRDYIKENACLRGEYGGNNSFKKSGQSVAKLEITKPATDQAKQWQGWGTALKPAYEPFILARKPLEGTYANNVLKHGVGGLNIDGCRIETSDCLNGGAYSKNTLGSREGPSYVLNNGIGDYIQPSGRFPANVIHDGLDEPWAKYFYCAKASKKDRDEGLENLHVTSAGEMTDREEGSDGLNSPRAGAGRTTGSRNIHPTVKPTELMRYLCRLVTPPNGLILDPFSGSGSTGKGAILEGFNFIGFEMDDKYCEIANQRVKHAHNSRIQP